MRKQSQQEFIDKCVLVHGEKYDYTYTLYKGLSKSIQVQCPTHGIFVQRAGDHLHRAAGCKKCKHEKLTTLHRNTFAEFLQAANKMHGSKYAYDSFAYVNVQTRIPIKCPKHKIFYQRPYSHVQGLGCPRCKDSKGERIVAFWLESNDINFIHQHRFSNCINPLTNRKLVFDFYLPHLSLAIEYDGEQHRKFIKELHKTKEEYQASKGRDQIKNEYCVANNIKLLRLTHKHDIPNILFTEVFKNS